jgi:hypothetical protein
MRLNRIRKSTSRFEQLMHASDVRPGTKLDWEISLVLDWLKRLEKNPSDTFAKHYMQGFGMHLARRLRRGDSEIFRDWAKATDRWKRHKPNPFKIEHAILAFCIPPENTFSVRDIAADLVSRRLIQEKTPVIEKKIRRLCRAANIKTDGKAGRPRIGTRSVKTR